MGDRICACATTVILVIAAVLFWHAHAQYGVLPVSGALDSGWWNWADQRRYLVAAQALSRLDFSPGEQWYEPGYALLAAPFVWITPADPFLVPNLAACLTSCWLFGRLGHRLSGGVRAAGPIGSAIFVAAALGSPLSSSIWIVPWSTTPVAPLALGGLLGALSFAERPRPAACLTAALCACGVGAFRPAEIGVIAGPASLLIVWTLARSGLARSRIVAIVGAGLAGFILPALTALGLHLAFWGWHLSAYLEQSRATGFEWSLIPLRFVSIFDGPQPLLAEGAGLARAFPWIMPGVAGMAACVSAPGRAAHLLIVGAAFAECALLLAYRDLHPTGLWRYSNYHYFKWLIPLFALYAGLLVQALVTRPGRARVLIAGAASMLLFCWRPGLDATGRTVRAEVNGRHELTLLSATTGVSDALLVAASGERDAIEQSDYYGVAADRQYASFQDFKAYARPGGFLLVPLRMLPAGLSITFPAGVELDPETPPLGVTQRAVFGVPCWRAACSGLR